MNDPMHPIDRSVHELLIVNDDPASRYASVRLLRNAGFRTREANNGMAALATADDSISVIVLDVNLPDIDGWEVVRRLRARAETARTPVLHLTAAYTSDEDKVRGLDSGADAYLTHPVEPAVLVATVQALVRTRVAEEAMRRSERKFRAIYAQAPGGICVLSPEGRVVDANPVMLQLLGRTDDVVIGHDLADFAAGYDAERMATWLRDSKAQVGVTEFTMQSPGGELTPLAWKLSRDIEPGVNLAVATDISQRNLLEVQRRQLLDSERVARGSAERMNRMKDELIAVLSHELRTPLNAIMGWAHVLQKRGGDEIATRGLAAIVRNVRVQARLISDILDMSRLNMGKMPLAFEMIDPAAVLDEAVTAMQSSAHEANVQLVIDMQPPHHTIRADSSRLQQIVWNLVSNAIKFSPPGGEIRVTLRDASDGLHLTITDQGQGIKPEFLPFLFDRFTQGEAGTNRQRGGLGLGLSIVKQLVEAHRGTIQVHSAGVGHGARFEILLPFDNGEVQVPDTTTATDDATPADDTEGLLTGLKVLVVDDDPDACTMLAIILSDRGALVTTVPSHDEALAALNRATPDVMVSDIGMPGRDGYDLIRAIRLAEAGTTHHLPAVALTSFTRQQDRQQVFEAGFDLHCSKPLRPLQVVQAVAGLAGRSSFTSSV